MGILPTCFPVWLVGKMPRYDHAPNHSAFPWDAEARSCSESARLGPRIRPLPPEGWTPYIPPRPCCLHARAGSPHPGPARLVAPPGRLVGGNSRLAGPCSRRVRGNSRRVGPCSRLVRGNSRRVRPCSRRVGGNSRRVGPCSRLVRGNSRLVRGNSQRVGACSQRVSLLQNLAIGSSRNFQKQTHRFLIRVAMEHLALLRRRRGSLLKGEQVIYFP